MEDVKSAVYEFSVATYEKHIKDFHPLIQKSAYELYSQYNSVIDFNDAKQEVLLCFYRCLLKFDSSKGNFIPYFKRAVKLLKSRFYYSYFHSINLNQRSEDLDAVRNHPVKDQPIHGDLYHRLSKPSQRMYDLFMHEGKLSQYNVGRTFNLRRCNSQHKINAFKEEIRSLVEV